MRGRPTTLGEEARQARALLHLVPAHDPLTAVPETEYQPSPSHAREVGYFVAGLLVGLAFGVLVLLITAPAPGDHLFIPSVQLDPSQVEDLRG